jgi:TorA maturation chaperone TorD
MHRALPAEEVARGDFYALLARMLHAAPDAALLSSLATAPALPDEGAPALARAWRDLVDASSVMDAEAAAAEFESLFVGVGKAAVSVYAGFYGGAPSIDHPRVRIQADMAALGLARRDTASEPEDHYAGLLDVMRVLAQGGAGRSAAALPEQQRFFETHLGQGLAMFFAALGKSEHANYYRKVAAFGAAFTVLETESFSLE